MPLDPHPLRVQRFQVATGSHTKHPYISFAYHMHIFFTILGKIGRRQVWDVSGAYVGNPIH